MSERRTPTNHEVADLFRSWGEAVGQAWGDHFIAGMRQAKQRELMYRRWGRFKRWTRIWPYRAIYLGTHPKQALLDAAALVFGR